VCSDYVHLAKARCPENDKFPCNSKNVISNEKYVYRLINRLYQ